MLTAAATGKATLSYAETFTPKPSVRLLEIPDGMLADVLEGKDNICFKGEPSDTIVMCTDTKTYELRLAETSNLLCLVQPGTEGEVPDHKISDCLGERYDLTETRPRLAQLRELLAEHPYKGAREDNSMQTEDDGIPKGYSRIELYERVQASNAEIDEALAGMHAVQVDGMWRLLDPDFETEMLKFVLNCAVEHDWPLERVPLKGLQGGLSEVLNSPDEVTHFLAVYASVVEEEDGDTFYKLSPERICQRAGLDILQFTDEKWPLDEFLAKWREYLAAINLDSVVDLSLLDGNALRTQAGDETYIVYFPVTHLSTNPRERFRELFHVRPKWTLKDIEPYISAIVPPGWTTERLLNKYARGSAPPGAGAKAEKIYVTRSV